VGEETKPRRRWLRRALWIGLAAFGAVAVACGASVTWTYVASGGHRYDLADAPTAPVVIVFGAKIRSDEPLPFLAGRLDMTVELVKAGKAQAVLVSGDAAGSSGNETRAMTAYLIARGIDPARIVIDPYGLDTYDTCARAVQVYGVQRALLVTQSYHLPRAVTLCRSLGMDADGVNADCGCNVLSLIKNQAREWLATVGAVQDAIWHRAPTVTSPPDDSLRRPAVR
jgi:SanA protein